MRITKKNSYFLSGAIVFAFFLIGALFLKNNASVVEQAENRAPAPSPASTTKPKTKPSVSPTAENADASTEAVAADGGFALENFHRSETKDGKLLWEVVGTNAKYFPSEKRVDIDECVFSSINDSGRKMVLRAGKAKLYLHGAELTSAKFSAKVTLDYGDDMKILTPRANYEHSKGFVTTPAHVKIIGEWYVIEGDGLRANLETKQYEILKNVSSILEPGKRGKSTS